MKKIFNLQMFADEEGATNNPASDSGTVENKGTDKAAAGNGQEDERKKPRYSDEDVDKMKVKWKRDQQKATDEAKKLAEMDAQQKAEYERDKLQKELDEYKRKDALAEMSKTARKLLSDANITIPDELLAMMVTTDAKETKTAIDSFAKLFKDSVENAVKERIRGNTPSRGTGNNSTVSEIEKRIKKYI